MATAGKVAPTPKDKFINGMPYNKLDVVEYNGTLYMAKKASSGVLPTNSEYWMLAVDLTGKLDATGDSENNTVTFTSNDAESPTAWQDVATLDSKEKHSSLFSKISTMFSNVRYLYKLLGTTDISALGTVTQALANLDGNVGDIKGIISSLADCSAATVAGYAADALAVKELNSNISELNSHIGWKEQAINIPFVNIDEQLLIDVGSIIKIEFYNDIHIIIGLSAVSKTNVEINVSLPIAPVGIIYNNNDITYEGYVYREGSHIIAIINNASFEIGNLYVKSIFYK